MDVTNVFHFFFSLFIPIGWAVILRPFFGNSFRGWPGFFVFILILSLICISTKELFDGQISINDIVSNLLGFFFGLMILSGSYQSMGRSLDRAEDKVVSDFRISLRSTLALIERIERMSSRFYEKAAGQLVEKGASELCRLLSKDALKRADRIRFILSGWRRKPEPPQLIEIIDRAFSSGELFSLDFSIDKSAKEVLEIALNHEKKKFKLFSRFESAFHEEWKVIRFELVLENLSLEISKIEQILAELRQS